MATSVQPGGAYAPSPIPQEARNRSRDIFFIQLDNLNVGANAAGIVLAPFSVDADADLLITGGAQRVTTVADRTTTLPDPAVLLSLTRTAAGRTLMNSPVPIAAMLGTGQRPARWEAPMLLRANSALAVTVTSFHGVALVVQVTFWGYKIFNT